MVQNLRQGFCRIVPPLVSISASVFPFGSRLPTVALPEKNAFEDV